MNSAVKYLFGYNIICDRYLIDTNIDFKLSYPKNKTDKWFICKLLNLFALKPDYHFVSTIPVHESVKRSKFKFEPFPDSPETLDKRLHLYNNELNKDDTLFFIDGMRERDEIKNQILNIVTHIT